MRLADRMGETLFLQSGEFSRAWPFFGLYFLLFAGFSVADAVTLSLFLERVGPAALPFSYALVAVLNLVLIGGYVWFAERLGGAKTFALILGPLALTFAGSWVAIRWSANADEWFTVLFVAREVAFTLILLHFGTYLQDYFTRDELNRVLPATYAGGRVGGIAGGWLLQHLSISLGPVDLLLVFVGLSAASLVVVGLIARFVKRSEVESSDPSSLPEGEREACESTGGFLKQVFQSRVLFWTTGVSFLFMVSRWILNYQYGHFLAEYFESPADLAAFLGRYTQWALLFTLLLQLFVLNRLVDGWGVGATYLLLASVLVTAAGAAAMPMTLSLAILCRFVETELRYGARNPLMQLINNVVSKPLRIRFRAWTMGVLTPAGTLVSSALLVGLARFESGMSLGIVGLGIALAHFFAAFGLRRSLLPKTGTHDGIQGKVD